MTSSHSEGPTFKSATFVDSSTDSSSRERQGSIVVVAFQTLGAGSTIVMCVKVHAGPTGMGLGSRERETVYVCDGVRGEARGGVGGVGERARARVCACTLCACLDMRAIMLTSCASTAAQRHSSGV